LKAVKQIVSVTIEQKEELRYYQNVLFYKSEDETAAKQVAEKLSVMMIPDETITSDLLLVLK